MPLISREFLSKVSNMPYKIIKHGEDFVVTNSETGKQVPGGNHGDDEDKAKRHLSALYAAVKDAKSMAEYDTALAIKSNHIFSIGELEAALDTAITNEPINRREGNIEQADLELRHATDFRNAIDLLQAGKSLPSELSNSISASLKSCLKGGPGSGRYPKGSGFNYVADDRHAEAAAEHASTLTKIADKVGTEDSHQSALDAHEHARDAYMAREAVGYQSGDSRFARTAQEKADEHSRYILHHIGKLDSLANRDSHGAARTEARNKDINVPITAKPQPLTDMSFLSPKKKSFSELKSAITERVEELSMKGGPGSGRYPKGYSSDKEKMNAQIARDKAMPQVYHTGTHAEKLNAVAEEFSLVKAGEVTWNNDVIKQQGFDVYKSKFGYIDIWRNGTWSIGEEKGNRLDELRDHLNTLESAKHKPLKGGSGSGNFGHSGRPGARGGSGEGGNMPGTGMPKPSGRIGKRGAAGSGGNSDVEATAKQIIDSHLPHDVEDLDDIVGEMAKISGLNATDLNTEVHNQIESEMKDIKRSINQFYQGSGYDIWGESTPSKSEYLDVVRDRTYDQLRDNKVWQSLSRGEQNKLILSVGP